MRDARRAPMETQPCATLTLPDGREVALPVLTDEAGAVFVDIRALHPTAGVCCFDPGFGSTAACASKITHVDGERGELLYRGVPVEQLAESSDFVDVAHLLLHGTLPSAAERSVFVATARSHRLVNESLLRFYQGFNHDAHPMAILVGVCGALSAFYNDGLETWGSPKGRDLACVRIISKLPTLAAMAYKKSKGQPFVYPRDDLSFAENFLYMCFAKPTAPFKLDPVAARCLDVIFILHADHEQNASTSTVRIAGSSQANPFACVAAGIASLWGPAHGGANEAVLKMLEEIGTVENIPTFVARAKDKSDPFRLMGFGHRIYKTTDPRAKLMREMCHRLLDHLKLDDPLLELAMALERVALEDEYFVKRRLYPNVDFYSGICFRALGIPVEMFTVIFAVARCIGWVSHWKEMASDPVPRICRPRQMYVGEGRRDYVPLAERPGEPLAEEEGEEDDGCRRIPVHVANAGWH